jgi:arylsulfatase A-like enzyme
LGQRTPAFNESDVSDKPRHIRAIPGFVAAEIDNLDEAYRNGLRTLQAVDEMIERLVTVLGELSETSNTYVVFASDNGYSFGAHRFTDKKVPYEEAAQIPLVIRGPGVPAGVRRNQLVANIDLAPTIAELAGATPIGSVDGRSLAPLLSATPPAAWREDLLIEFWFAGRDAVPDYVGLRRETATESQMYAQYPSGDAEFYDLRVDPHQLEGRVAGNPAAAQRLAERMRALQGCSGASCR